jgi:signal transduction histidine kinase
MTNDAFNSLLNECVRHDLSNAIFSIQGMMEIIDEEIADEKRKKIIWNQLTRATNVINLWRKLDRAGKPSWQDLDTMLLRIKLEAGVSPLMLVDVPALKINANPLLNFVFSNLIDNTVRYSQKEDVKIKISGEVIGRNLLIIYEDNGIGIPDQDKERIFSQGFGKNTGLGMFFTREILSLMGSIIIENGVPGQGVRFEIRMPEDVFKTSDGDL